MYSNGSLLETLASFFLDLRMINGQEVTVYFNIEENEELQIVQVVSANGTIIPDDTQYKDIIEQGTRSQPKNCRLKSLGTFFNREKERNVISMGAS